MTDAEVRKYLQVMRDLCDDPLQAAVLEAAIERFGVCRCGSCEPMIIGGVTVWWYPILLHEGGHVMLEAGAFCPACGRRMEVPDG